MYVYIYTHTYIYIYTYTYMCDAHTPDDADDDDDDDDDGDDGDGDDDGHSDGYGDHVGDDYLSPLFVLVVAGGYWKRRLVHAMYAYSLLVYTASSLVSHRTSVKINIQRSSQ